VRLVLCRLSGPLLKVTEKELGLLELPSRSRDIQRHVS
jgi:hypothetical protein